MVKIKNNSLTHLETVDKAAIKLRKLIEDAEDTIFILKDALNKAIKEKENFDRENTK